MKNVEGEGFRFRRSRRVLRRFKGSDLSFVGCDLPDVRADENSCVECPLGQQSAFNVRVYAVSGLWCRVWGL